MINTVLTVKTVLQTNQTDLSQEICSLLERFCRQIKQTYHGQSVPYQNRIVDKSNKSIIDTVITIKMVWQTNQTDLSQKICSPLERDCRQIKQIYHMQYGLYQNGIVDKSNRPIIDTVLAIRAVLQKNQTDISQTICSLLERYCRPMKQTYHRHYVLCQNGIVDKSNIPIMDNMCYIRTVLQTNQTELSQTLF